MAPPATGQCLIGSNTLSSSQIAADPVDRCIMRWMTVLVTAALSGVLVAPVQAAAATNPARRLHTRPAATRRVLIVHAPRYRTSYAKPEAYTKVGRYRSRPSDDDRRPDPAIDEIVTHRMGRPERQLQPRDPHPAR